MDKLEYLHKRGRSQLPGSPRLLRAAESVAEFPRRASGPVSAPGRMALDLVDQAAQLVRSIEGQARETENRAKTLAEDAIKGIQAADKQIHSLKGMQIAAEAYIKELKAKLAEVQEALVSERARAQADESRMLQLETRARMAEARAEECEGALSQIVDAIRAKILRQQSLAGKRANAA